MTKEEFINALKEKNIDLSPEQIQQFETYMTLLKEWNEKMNLTAIVQDGEIWEKHFYDSILPFIGKNFASLADVGSGAGFPGIPVKIVWPQTDLTIIEPLQKRCRFLEEVKNQLGLENVHIHAARAEDFAKDHRESFDALSARAVARLSILLELCAPLIKKGGWMVALKGKNGMEELAAAKKAIDVLGLELKETSHDELDEGSRINFYFQKTSSTPARYPRNYGQIKKSPLEG